MHNTSVWKPAPQAAETDAGLLAEGISSSPLCPPTWMLSDGGEGQNRVINRKNNEKERRHEQTRQQGNDYLDKRQQGSGSSGSTECGEWTSGRVGAPLGREPPKDAASTGSMCWRMWWQGLGLAPGAMTESVRWLPLTGPERSQHRLKRWGTRMRGTKEISRKHRRGRGSKLRSIGEFRKSLMGV